MSLSFSFYYTVSMTNERLITNGIFVQFWIGKIRRELGGGGRVGIRRVEAKRIHAKFWHEIHTHTHTSTYRHKKSKTKCLKQVIWEANMVVHCLKLPFAKLVYHVWLLVIDLMNLLPIQLPADVSGETVEYDPTHKNQWPLYTRAVL